MTYKAKKFSLFLIKNINRPRKPSIEEVKMVDVRSWWYRGEMFRERSSRLMSDDVGVWPAVSQQHYLLLSLYHGALLDMAKAHVSQVGLHGIMTWPASLGRSADGKTGSRGKKEAGVVNNASCFFPACPRPALGCRSSEVVAFCMAFTHNESRRIYSSFNSLLCNADKFGIL